jgi:6-pyruvoyltetrahydropterin/6-carboxytetrahydropterin synthase
MTYTIAKDFTFSAAHHLDGLPEGHQCARPHGHNYLVRVELSGELDAVGFVFDYGRLEFFSRYLDTEWDHQDLNERVDFNPTAENLAAQLWRVVDTTVAGLADGVSCTGVGVSETPKTWAWYRP